MTILHLCRSFGKKRIGGAERNIYNLINLISSNTSEKNIILSDNGLWNYSKNNNIFKKDERYNFYSLIYLIFARGKNKISNIHVHSNGLYIFLGYLISLINRSRLIIKITGVGEGKIINRNKEIRLNLKLILKNFLFKIICKSSNVYIHILSKSCLENVKKLTDNIIIFPNLVKKGVFNSGIKKKDTFVISSRLIKKKNIDLTLEKLLSLKNNNIQIFIMGDGPEMNRLKLKYINYKSIISFLGYLEESDIYYYYKKSEYFINLSENEGMSNALLEAMTCGCKCIVSNILENVYTSGNYAIYYDKKEDFILKLKESTRLNPKDISNYANSKYAINFFNPKKLRELYQIDNHNISFWQ